MSRGRTSVGYASCCQFIRSHMIPAVIERCAGIDIGKKTVAVCVMTGAADREPRVEFREYGTTTGELQQLCDWLQQKQCTHVAAESTGSYWTPVFAVLE